MTTNTQGTGSKVRRYLLPAVLLLLVVGVVLVGVWQVPRLFAPEDAGSPSASTLAAEAPTATTSHTPTPSHTATAPPTATPMPTFTPAPTGCFTKRRPQAATGCISSG